MRILTGASSLCKYSSRLFTARCSLYTIPMSWASRRRTLYLTVIGAVVALFVGVPIAYFLYQEPTCTDGAQNQGETAPDKGGPCDILDERAISPEALLFARAFPVREGEYGITAYVQNPNRGAGVASARYRFSVYDERNVLVAEREGVTSLQPGAITPIYEAGIRSGERAVSRTFFEFTGPLTWVKANGDADSLQVSGTRVSDITGTPRVSATVTNTGIGELTDISYVATLFDTAGNAFASSKTVIPSLEGGESKAITFIWPRPFSVAPARIDVLPVMGLSFE